MADIEYPLESLRLYACTEWGTRLQTSAIQTLADEVMSIELGDQRLTRRTGKILEQLFRQPCNRMGTCDEGKADSVDTHISFRLIPYWTRLVTRCAIVPGTITIM